MSKGDKVNYLFLALLLSSIFIYSFFRDKNREAKLENVKVGEAKFEKYYSRTVKDDECGYFHYSVSGKTYSFREAGNFSYLRKGDFVKIEYSIDDPSIARIRK